MRQPVRRFALPQPMSKPVKNRIVGNSVPRKEGVDKLRGTARYVDDIQREGMWHGATVRSSVPRARIRSISFDSKINWSEFTVVGAADIPGQNRIQMIVADQPCLADCQVNHCEEAILLIAHHDKNKVREAVNAVHVEYDSLPPIFTIEESEKQQTVIWGENNCFKSFLLNKGDVDAAWANAAHIVEGEYRTGAQEHLYIENNGVIAEYSARDGITVWGSLQCPFYVHKSLLTVFELPPERVRVIQTETGGAFGGKEDYPSVLASHAALLAMKSGHPVKMVYDRIEDLAATTKRHPSRVRHRTALDSSGKLLAMDIDIATDGGAYSTLSSTVLSRATLHSPGPYVCPNVRVRSHAWATNNVPYGAFRGFGAPQTVFAVERHIDEVASAIGMDPISLRRKNFIHQGETTATEQLMREPVLLDKLLDRALAESHFYNKRIKFAKDNAHSPVKRGIGIACFYHGSGFTGSGERYLNSLAGIDVTANGKVRVLVSSTEFGQGTNTVLSQVAAETLGLEFDDVTMAPPDTSVVPNSGPTVASRTAMVIGRIIERSCLQLIAMLRDEAGLREDFSGAEQFFTACERLRKTRGEVVSLCRYEAPPGIFWDDHRYHGEAYPAFAWSVQVAQVAVDTITYSAEVEEFWSVQEAGRVINPVLAGGQIEGGIAQGIGYALYEKVILQNGRMANNQMTNYIMPTAEDVPPIHIFWEELPFEHGGFGAKGIGELPLDGPAPAILNAIRNAIDVSFNSIPLLPEDLFAKLTVQRKVEEPATV